MRYKWSDVNPCIAYTLINFFFFRISYRLRWCSHTHSKLKIFYGYLNELKQSSSSVNRINYATNSLQCEVYDGSREHINPLNFVKRAFGCAYQSIVKNRMQQASSQSNNGQVWSDAIDIVVQPQESSSFNSILIIGFEGESSERSFAADLRKVVMNYIHYIIPVSAIKAHKPRFPTSPVAARSKTYSTYPSISRIIGTEHSPPDARGRKYFKADPCTILEIIEHSNLRKPVIFRRIGDNRLKFLQLSFDHEAFSTHINDRPSQNLWAFLDQQVTMEISSLSYHSPPTPLTSPCRLWEGYYCYDMIVKISKSKSFD